MLQDLKIAMDAPETEDGAVLEWKGLRSSGGSLSAYRAKVPGGWLVYVCNGFYHHGGVAFYPDPGHLWRGES